MRALFFATLLAVACGGSPPPATESADDVMGPADGNAERRTVFSSSSYLTVGVRVRPGATDTDPVRLEAVVVDVDGNESVHDLGEYVGQASEQAAGEGEIGRVHLTVGDETRQLTLRTTESPQHLELHLDGEPVRRLELPTPHPVRAGAPFLLHPPTEE